MIFVMLIYIILHETEHLIAGLATEQEVIDAVVIVVYFGEILGKQDIYLMYVNVHSAHMNKI